MRFEHNKVYNTITKSSKLACNFLKYIHQQGFTKSPYYYGSNNKEYILSYVEGKTYNLDYPIVNEKIIVSSVKLLCKYHHISEKFTTSELMQKDNWMFEARNPIQVICHNDFAPYNICYIDS